MYRRSMARLRSSGSRVYPTLTPSRAASHSPARVPASNVHSPIISISISATRYSNPSRIPRLRVVYSVVDFRFLRARTTGTQPDTAPRYCNCTDARTAPPTLPELFLPAGASLPSLGPVAWASDQARRLRNARLGGKCRALDYN